MLHTLFAKELPVAPYQRSINDIHNDSGADGYPDSKSTKQPICVLKEYWGPNGRGRKIYCLRLFKVRFDDGSNEDLVAEDVMDGCANPFETNAFYSEILAQWRQDHAKAVRPASARLILASRTS